MILDSRAVRARGIKPLARNGGVIVHFEPVFCVSCGHQNGHVTHGLDRADGPLIYLCAANPGGCGCDCERRFGRPPEMFTPVPDPDDYRSHR